jgi:[ribosomal protein S5]-alanine N-acetyltransferase
MEGVAGGGHHSWRRYELETARLRLRPCVESDVGALHRLWTDPQVRRYLWDDMVIGREQAAEVVRASAQSFAAHGFGQWVIYPREGGELIGFCGLRHFGEPPEVEVLYGLRPAFWGRGLATEAARAMLGDGFSRAGLRRIYAGTDPPNAASVRVMEKAGMTFDRRTCVNGLEAVYYVVTREAFRDAGPHALRVTPAA